ncbi:MAG TPA: DUF2207 domain-containing protein [Xanthomonadales bacterium]|nr:DUF2207 domain-containing protein [Xanthomonadales bacterium]
MSVHAEERILNYHSDVQVSANGELAVTETITVFAEGQQIRRGIYREFPTDYKDPMGNHYRVDFTVIGVQRNGQDEPWHTEQRPNGVRLYIGDADRMLPQGQHEYRIQFTTNRQLGFFPDHDQLWWNVTGNGWIFPIERVSARITLPFSIQEADYLPEAFLGAFGSREQGVLSEVVDGSTVEFSSPRALQAHEGMSVVLSWRKGLIAEPGMQQKMLWFARDNGAVIVLLVGLLAQLYWYLRSWNKVGRDPEKGVIIPLFTPPQGLSPAAVRYVKDMAFGRHSFTAAVISLAVKGYVRIEEDDKEFTLYREKPAAGAPRLSPGETAVLNTLLPGARKSIKMEQENHSDFSKAQSLLKTALKKEYQGQLFHLNGIYLLAPVMIVLGSVLVAAFFPSGPAAWVIFVALSALMLGLFAWLMRAPTPAGRRIMDHIEGFRMYLNTAEQDRLDRMQSPKLTPEVFEAFLPYAYALGVQNKWCQRFERELPEELREQGYNPGWYSGQFHGMHALNHLGSDFGSSMSSAISSASTAPGSSSGSGGGGFSGGGGGGGGGGGW